MNLKKMLSDFYDKNCMMAAFFISIVMLWLDYITGRSIQFPIFYIIPIGMLAWKEHLISSYLAAFILSMARVWFHYLWIDSESIYVTIVNLIFNIIALFFYIFLIKNIVDMKKSLERKVKVLEGILPICPVCNKIRNDSGDYEDIEKYITEHSEAVFSHGLCGNCSREFYPKYFQDKMKFLAKMKND